MRRIAATMALAAVLGAGLLIYQFGLRHHPHHLVLGLVLAGIYLVVFGGGYALIYRSQLAAARRM